MTGELERQLEIAKEPLENYPQWKDAYVKAVIEEARSEFPFSIPKGCNSLNQVLLYWEDHLKMAKTSTEDRRVYISWVESSVKSLKWFVKWFGNKRFAEWFGSEELKVIEGILLGLSDS
jgi:hypothetical protein